MKTLSTLAERHIGLQAWLMNTSATLNLSMLDLVKNSQLLHSLLQQDIYTLIDAYKSGTPPMIRDVKDLARQAEPPTEKFIGQ